MTTKIRKAKKEDFVHIWPLLEQLFVNDKISKTKTQKLYLNLLKNKESVEFVLEHKKQIIGYAAVYFRPDIQVQGRIGYLSELVMDETVRGQGFGTKFLKKVSSNVKKMKCKEIQFPSNFKRKKAHKFYEKLDFKKTAFFFRKKI